MENREARSIKNWSASIRRAVVNVLAVIVVFSVNAAISALLIPLAVDDHLVRSFIGIQVVLFVVALAFVASGIPIVGYIIAILCVPVSFGYVVVMSPLRLSPHGQDWTEEVRLEDNTNILVRRSVSFGRSYLVDGNIAGGEESDLVISFTGQLSSLPPWKDRTIPLVLYKDGLTGEWVVVTTTNSCTLWAFRGKPKPVYWESRLNESGWKDASVSPSSIGRSVNLLHKYRKMLPSELITEDVRIGLEKEYKVDGRFRSILADANIGCN